MELSDFAIGETFWTHVGAFRCTDVGTRVVVAVKLGPREIGRAEKVDGELRITKRIDDDPSWLNGPPYAVEEVVFDENELLGCFRILSPAPVKHRVTVTAEGPPTALETSPIASRARFRWRAGGPVRPHSRARGGASASAAACRAGWAPGRGARGTGAHGVARRVTGRAPT